MGKVIITKELLNNLAQSIAVKASAVLPLTIPQMIDAVDNLSLSSDVNFQSKIVTPTTSVQTILPDTGYQGLSSVRVGAINATDKTITANGTYTAPEETYYNSITVNVENTNTFTTQSKTATPTAVSQIIEPDDGYDGLSAVTVTGIPSNYADIDGVTATASDVITGRTFVDNSGTLQNGILTTTNYYVGSTTPDSSFGINGDIYLKV